jgi:hypothetical protein
LGELDKLLAANAARSSRERLVGDLLGTEIKEKRARSIKDQITVARLPLAKDIEDFDFEAAEINVTLVRDLAGGAVVERQNTFALVGDQQLSRDRSERHLRMALARAPVPSLTPASAAAPEAASSRSSIWSAGWTPKPAWVAGAAWPTTSPASTFLVGETVRWTASLPALMLDEPGLLPVAQSVGQLVRRENRPPDGFPILLTPPCQPAHQAHLGDRHHQPRLRRMAGRLRRRQDGCRAARPAHPSLRHRRDRQ